MFPPPLNTRVAHLDLSMYPPFYFVGAFNLSMYGGGVACVCLSLATVYLLLFVCFVAFHVVFFSFFFTHCLFFPSSAALQFEGKGGRKRKTR